jgi:hypothetical protein
MDKEPETKEHVQYLKLLNSGTKNLTFHLEPWGDQFPMAPKDEEYQIVARGPDNDCLSFRGTTTRLSFIAGPGLS